LIAKTILTAGQHSGLLPRKLQPSSHRYWRKTTGVKWLKNKNHDQRN